MTVDIGLCIGGLSFLVRGPEERIQRLRSGRYIDFRRPVDNPDILIEILEEPVDPGQLPPAGKPVSFDSGTVWRLLETDGAIQLLLSSPSGSSTPYRMATFNADLSHGVIASVAGSGADLEDISDYDPLEFPLSEILMVCLLSRGRGLMVHACGISDRGDGLLFPGNSTDGKSTIAGLWQNTATVLNDDRIILRPSPDGFMMFGTPWHGDMSDVSAEKVLLRSVDFLHHGRSNRREPAKGTEAVSKLLQRSFLPLWDRKGMEFTLEFCSRLAGSVDFHDLHFRPDSSIVDFLRCRN